MTPVRNGNYGDARPLMSVAEITVPVRFRLDLGDLSELQASISELGLLCPVAVDRQGRLIHGHRRLEACRRLGWTEVPVVVLGHLDAALDLLRAERDENTCRLPMSPSELTRLGMEIERLEQPEAEARKRTGGEQGRASRYGLAGARTSTSQRPVSEKTVERVGRALGVSRSTYQRRRRLVADAQDPALSEEQRRGAQEAIDEVDRTGNTTGPYERYMKRHRPRPTVAVTPRRATVATASVTFTADKQRQVIDRTLAALDGLAYAVAAIDALHPELSPDEAARWAADLSKPLATLASFRRLLKERGNGNAE